MHEKKRRSHMIICPFGQEVPHPILYFCSIKIQWHFFRFLSIVIIHFCDLKLATKTIN